jgi:predicted nucleotidyltransferase
MLDLSSAELTLVQAILGRHVPTHTVWAFGSRTRGTAVRHSDLDLAILSDTPLPYTLIGTLREAFSESDLPFRVDILDWATTTEPFRRVVEADRIVVQPPPLFDQVDCQHNQRA